MLHCGAEGGGRAAGEIRVGKERSNDGCCGSFFFAHSCRLSGGGIRLRSMQAWRGRSVDNCRAVVAVAFGDRSKGGGKVAQVDGWASCD